MTELDYFKARFGLRDEDLLLVPWGSRVYGTDGPDSDDDYLAIVPLERRAISRQLYERNGLNVFILNTHDFQQDLDRHTTHALESYYLPGSGVAERFPFRLSRQQLRREWMRHSSNSWVKAKKKLRIENDPGRARKSLFHSLRILAFGRQLAELGTLADYRAANGYWEQIRAMPLDEPWETYQDRWQAVRNELARAFRRAAG